MDHSALTPAAPRGASFRLPHPNRRTLVKGVAWSAPVLAVATTAPALAASSPTAQCFPEGTLFNAQTLGRLASGAIGGIDLDTVAAVEGVHAQAFDPLAPGADSTDRDERANPLSVEALSALRLNLGGLSGALSTILDLTAGQNVGAVNQYALATAAAEETDTADIGGSGTVSDNGTLELATGNDGPPQLGTLNLRSVLAEATELPGVADLVASVADLTLEIGALGGLVTADSLCEVPETEQVDRRYVLASLGLDVETPVVGELLSALESALPELTISTSAVWDLLEGVPLLGELLAALGESALEVTATVDVSQLTTTIPDDPNAALQLGLGDGKITIDLASLLGGAYTGDTSDWLNERGPNTRLFVDAGLPGDAVTGLVETWVDTLVERLKDLVSVTVRAGSVNGLLATGLLIEGSLRDFLEGTATATFSLLGVPIRLGSLLNPLLGGIGELVESTLRTLLNDNAVLDTAFDGVNALLSTLFDVLSGVLAITVNAQNNSTGGTTPSYYQSINDPARFDVAALHLEVLGVANLLNLSLGRGIYGPNVARTASSDSAGFRLPFAN